MFSKPEVELLAKALAKYADCLCIKKARMTMLQVYQHERLAMPEYISSQHTVPAELDAFSTAVSNGGVNVAVDIDTLLPSDHR